MDKKRQAAGRVFCLAMGLLLLLCGCSPVAGQVSPTPTAEVTPSPTPAPVPTDTPAPEFTPEPTPMLDLPDGTVSLDGREYHYNPDSASHDTYEIDVGDGEHVFRLEAVSAGLWPYDFTRDLTLSFYEGKSWKPVQVIETDVGVWPQYFELCVEDINFDGYMDFYYLYSQGTHNRYYAYYVWDKETEQFVEDPYGLSEFENPYFNHEINAVESWYRTSIWGGSHSYYRYLDGQLICVRVCAYSYEHDPESATLRVKDLVDGELKTVFEVTRASDQEFTEAEEEEYSRWYDLDYHGES